MGNKMILVMDELGEDCEGKSDVLCEWYFIDEEGLIIGPFSSKEECEKICEKIMND